LEIGSRGKRASRASLPRDRQPIRPSEPSEKIDPSGRASFEEMIDRPHQTGRTRARDRTSDESSPRAPSYPDFPERQGGVASQRARRASKPASLSHWVSPFQALDLSDDVGIKSERRQSRDNLLRQFVLSDDVGIIGPRRRVDRNPTVCPASAEFDGSQCSARPANSRLAHDGYRQENRRNNRSLTW
jgi:hypothetical protein